MTVHKTEEEKDRAFLEEPGDSFAIYQIDSEAGYHFMGMDHVINHGLIVSREDYRMVYHGKLAPEETLERIYEKFNRYHPEDYTGYSLSMSDIIVLKKDGKPETFYVDSVGFARLREYPNTKGWDILLLPEKTEFLTEATMTEEELAVKTPVGYFSIQTTEEGYDYTFYDLSFHETDGGVYDDPEVSIRKAAMELLAEEGFSFEECSRVDYEDLEEKTEKVGQEDLQKGQEHFRKEQFLEMLDEIKNDLEMTEAIHQYIREVLQQMGIDPEILKQTEKKPQPEPKSKEQAPLDRGFQM